MPDDQVTIDPQFQPPPPGDDQSRWLRVAGVGAVVAAAFIFGWLLRSPEPAEPETVEAVSTSTTALTGDTTTSTTRSRPSTTTTVAEPVGLAVPLGEAVPGFTDTITMTSLDGDDVAIHRWRVWNAAPELAVTLGDDWRGGRFNGLDASGRWYARLSDDGLLMVHPTADVDEESWLEPPHADVLAARVVTAVWHDTEPGQLAWVTCSLGTLPRPQGETQPTGTLFTYNLETDLLEEPQAEQTVDARCDAMFVPEPELGRWSLSGLDYWTGYDGVWLQSDGPEIDVHSAPSLTDSEWLEDYRWSPDGNLLGYTFLRNGADYPMIRVVDAAGAVLTEMEHPGRALWVAEWSTDSRFLLFKELPGVGAESPYRVWLGFYDTATDTTVVLPLPDSVLDVRTADPAPPAELVAHYPLDGDGTDLSDYGHDGLSIGEATTTADRFGTPKGALTFDGDNDYIVIEMTPQLATDTVSIATWIRIDDTNTLRTEDQDHWYVASYGVQGHFLAVNVSGAAVVGVHHGWSDCSFRATSTTVDDGRWHHLAMTRTLDGTTRLYLDGQAQSIESPDQPSSADPTAATCTATAAFDDQVWIGGDPRDRALFNGAIDDVRIHTGVLTDDEIAALASVPLLTAADLPGEWNEVDDDASFWLPEGLCPQIASHQEIFLDNVRPESPNYSTPLIEARFMREESILNQGIYASGYMTVDQMFTHFRTLLTDCAVETDGTVTTGDHTASIDLIDLPGLDRDYVAVEWIIDRVSRSSEETRLVIVHLGEVLLVLNAGEGFWPSPEESLGVSDAEFEAIVHAAVARAVGDTDP